MHNWLKHFDLHFVQSHCSGHISGGDWKDLINDIQPKKLYPIHTEHPGMFRGLGIHSHLIKEGKTYKL